MKVKTSELTGHALDWAVAKCEGEKPELNRGEIVTWKTIAFEEYRLVWNPSSNWMQGGAIIEREGIDVLKDGAHWTSLKTATAHHWHIRKSGSTPLIATMRCYVTSKLGDEVEIPDAFKQEHV